MNQNAKFLGPMSTWVIWANSQFDAWKVSVNFLSHLVAFFDTSQHTIRDSSQGSSFWG